MYILKKAVRAINLTCEYWLSMFLVGATIFGLANMLMVYINIRATDIHVFFSNSSEFMVWLSPVWAIAALVLAAVFFVVVVRNFKGFDRLNGVKRPEGFDRKMYTSFGGFVLALIAMFMMVEQNYISESADFVVQIQSGVCAAENPISAVREYQLSSRVNSELVFLNDYYIIFDVVREPTHITDNALSLHEELFNDSIKESCDKLQKKLIHSSLS